MSSMGTIVAGDVGTPITLTILDETGAAVDISTGTQLTIYLLPPGVAEGSATAYAATRVGDGTTGQMTYSLVAQDVSIAGRWRVQGRVVLASGSYFRTSVAYFDALDVI